MNIDETVTSNSLKLDKVKDNQILIKYPNELCISEAEATIIIKELNKAKYWSGETNEKNKLFQSVNESIIDKSENGKKILRAVYSIINKFSIEDIAELKNCLK